MFHQLEVSLTLFQSTQHLIKLLFFVCQLAISPTYWFNLPTCSFIKIMHKLAVFSIYHCINLPLHQLALWPISQKFQTST
jgi:hypothetical protein